jgi:hypothetical protein
MDYTFRDLHMTGVPVERISIVADHWNSLFFEILSRHAPNVLHVEYSNVGDELPYMGDEDEGVGENTEEDANLILASPFFFLLCLEYAAHRLFKEVSHPFCADSIIHDFWTWGRHQRNNHGVVRCSSQFSSDYEMLQCWGKICPSLKICRLPPRE